MIDVSSKAATDRSAVAQGIVLLSKDTLEAVRRGDTKKGDVRSTAELAGVMAGKKTADLIPLCHPIPLTHIEVQIDYSDEPAGVVITASTRTKARTGVEMEALTAVAVAALTVYDMVKGIDRSARLTDIRLIEKRGGKSGDFVLEEWADGN